jgi:hypothetical protein
MRENILRQSLLEIGIVEPFHDYHKWIRQDISFEQLWNECENPSYLLCLSKSIGVDDHSFTRVKAMLANTVRHLILDNAACKMIDVAMQYGCDQISHRKLEKMLKSLSGKLSKNNSKKIFLGQLIANRTISTNISDQFNHDRDLTLITHIRNLISLNSFDEDDAKENNFRNDKLMVEIIRHQLYEKVCDIISNRIISRTY